MMLFLLRFDRETPGVKRPGIGAAQADRVLNISAALLKRGWLNQGKSFVLIAARVSNRWR
jgi:hypothetical protein